MEDAVYFGHQAIVAYLVQNRPELSHSRLEIVEWLHDNAPDSYTPEAFSKACEEGDVDVVSFFLDCEHEFNVEMLQAAADNSSDLAQMMYDSLSLDRARVLLKEATDNGSECGEIAQCLESLIAKLAASSKPNSK
ncbi:hypothetical protein BC831DRAFT_485270 [Entophlyctis helioformis]|nr:hypothetical protein BC831DRAFT_485270 [Entophlyctis helioformis]